MKLEYGYKNQKCKKKDLRQVAEIVVNGWKTAYKGISDDEYLDSLNVEDNFFKGDVYFYNFSDVKEKILIPSGKCILDNNYKWLEFYNYDSRVKLTAIYDKDNEIIEWYFDIAREIGKENGVPYEDDLYLDVVVTPSGDVILLDEDELKEAFDKKEMTKEEYDEAYKIAYDLMEKLRNNKNKLNEYTDIYLKQMLGGITQ